MVDGPLSAWLKPIMQAFTPSSWRQTSRDADSLNRFLSDIQRYPPLTTEAEVAAFTALRAGDTRQRDRLARHNQRFLLSVAKLYYKKEGALTLGDLVQFGNEGLLVAIDRFDVSLGFKFISFAVKWIRKYITQEMARHSEQITLPPHLYFAQLKERRLQERHLTATGEHLSEELLEAELDEKECSMLRNARLAARVSFSLDGPDWGGRADGLSTHETIGDALVEHASDEQAHQHTQLRRALGQLSERDAAVVRALYGIDGETQDRKAIQQQLGISKAGVELAHKRGLAALRGLLGNHS